MDSVSNVGVLDKAVAVLRALERDGPSGLAELQAATGLPRATAHRLAVALEQHGLVRRDGDGRFCLGLGARRPRPRRRRRASRSPTSPARRSTALRDETGESVQLFVREGDGRRCVVSLQSPHGLRWIVPEGALLPLARRLGRAGAVRRARSGRLGRERRGARAGRGVGQRAGRRRRRPAARRRQRQRPGRAPQPATRRAPRRGRRGRGADVRRRRPTPRVATQFVGRGDERVGNRDCRGAAPGSLAAAWHGHDERAAARATARCAARALGGAVGSGRLTYPEALPITARRDELLATIRDHQVVVVAGETGSGKSTQLPKLCLELGRGVDGLIGHTQPRRVAARTIAERVAEELGSTIGGDVGFSVRFDDRVGDGTLVRVMTDGILLAELQRDRDLRRYDTLIIDEAHERSLNIDFILGYLRQLLPRRPDLKVIVTSATIDTARFARHFGVGDVDAPVIEVTGRTYPVEVRYRPFGDEPDGDGRRDQVQAISDAVDELAGERRHARVPVRRAGDPRHRRLPAPARAPRHRGPAAVRPPVGAASSTASSSPTAAGASCSARTSPRRRSPCPACAPSSTPARRASPATAGG